ncbi:MAG TPA: hypothetical protein VJC16_06840 [Candidatus Nanoarchaeia archaeon]|nr:hypothetical protein [Candidatus Nanoarchaeia archaeon]
MAVCPFCNRSRHVSRMGKRKTNIGSSQRFFCTSCKRSFVQRTPFTKRHYRKQVIEDAVGLYRHTSLSKARKLLWQKDHVHVARYTISRWFKRYFWLFRR